MNKTYRIITFGDPTRTTRSLSLFCPPPELNGFCMALLDQDRYIGPDPVGHACRQPAVHSIHYLHFQYDLCQECSNLLAQNLRTMGYLATI